jgi:hypothetical protein
MGAVVVGGRHAGKTLPRILFTDPDWFFNAFEEDHFQQDLDAEAKILAERQ